MGETHGTCRSCGCAFSYPARGGYPKQRCGDCTAYRVALTADPCSYCGEVGARDPKGYRGFDHIDPKSAGGSSERWENLAGACRSCNSSKHTKRLLAFLVEKTLRDRIVKLEREVAIWQDAGWHSRATPGLFPAGFNHHSTKGQP